MSEDDARVRTLMIVHAHPDDESSQTGGTLARYAAAGYRTVLVTCTDGALGDAADSGAKPGQPGHDPRQVAAVRSRELDAAAEALGVHDVVELGYPDSGMSSEGVPMAEDSFGRRPLKPMVTRLVELLRLYQPDVLITYPANGLSGHPDHIRTHELVVAAHDDLVANGASAQVPKLYYIAMSASRIRAAQAAIRAAFGEDVWVPPEEMGVDDAQITTVIDVTPFWGDKLRALAAHASQSDAAMVLKMFSFGQDSAEPVVQVEEYMRAYPPVEVPVAVVERDFFDAAGPA
jgi:LmbE family N-acetylglucosaminyl deacetylase